MEKYIVISKPTCPFCVKAIELLTEKGLDKEVISFGESDEEKARLSLMKGGLGHPTVPIVISVDGSKAEIIGGYTDLAERLALNE
jgi:glutaredoxin